MLTLAAALLCMEESLNRFESTSNEREMSVKVLHVLGKHEWNPEYMFSGRVLFGVSGSPVRNPFLQFAADAVALGVRLAFCARIEKSSQLTLSDLRPFQDFSNWSLLRFPKHHVKDDRAYGKWTTHYNGSRCDTRSGIGGVGCVLFHTDFLAISFSVQNAKFRWRDLGNSGF